MGDLVYLVRAEDLDDLPTGPPARLQRPTYRTDQRLDDWLGEGGIDWDAETVGPLTRGAVPASTDGGGSTCLCDEKNPDQDRQAEGAVIIWPGGQQ